MSSETPTSLWAKVDYDLLVVPEAAPSAAQTEATAEQWLRFWRWRRPMLDGIGTLLWVYATLKVFVTDIDTQVAGDAVRYRLFFFLGVAVLLALVLRRRWPILGGFAYVFGFPLVVVFWKFPKFLGKTRNAVAFLAAANALTSLLSDIKYSIVATTVAAFTALAIATSHSSPILAVASLALTALLANAIFRTIKRSVLPSTFLRVQQQTIRRVVESNIMRQMISPGDALRRSDIQKFTAEQQTTFVNNLGNGVIANRGLAYWAYQLERYRRSATSIVLNGISYFWLLIRTVLALAFINLALFHADSAAFTFEKSPTFLVFTRYVIAGFYGGEIGALHPKSNLANAISVATFVTGAVVVSSLLLSLLLSFRATRNESEIRETVAEIKRDGAALEKRMREEYEVSVPEAIARLEQLKFALSGLIRFLSTRIPTDFEDYPTSRQ